MNPTEEQLNRMTAPVTRRSVELEDQKEELTKRETWEINVANEKVDYIHVTNGTSRVCSIARMGGFLEVHDPTLLRVPPGYQLLHLETYAVPMILHCPGCNARHVDQGEHAEKLHKVHACQQCGMLWQPALVPTVGVHFLPGTRNAR